MSVTMVNLVENSRDISKYQRSYVALIRKYFPKKISNKKITFRPNHIITDVYYNSEIGVWCAFINFEEVYMNAYGTQDPSHIDNLRIVVQVSIPKIGPNGRVAGAYGIDSNGSTLMLHRGNIGGGKKGVGKHLFFETYSADTVTGHSKGKEADFAVVTQLEAGDFFPMQIANFVKTVEEMKASVDNTNNNKNPSKQTIPFSYFDESFGQSKTKGKKPGIIIRRHGIIQQKLKNELSKRRFKLANDKKRDLFIYKNQKMTTLFEIKTEINSQDLYKAIGQLHYYCCGTNPAPQMVFVHPEDLPKEVVANLKNLGIHSLAYSWEKSTPVFTNLDILLKQKTIK